MTKPKTTPTPTDADHHAACTAIRAKFSLKHLLMAAAFRATNDIRYYLNGVHVMACRDGGVFVVGCDGHTMLVAYDAAGTIENAPNGVTVTVNPGLLAAAAKNKCRRDGVDMFAIVEGQRLSVNHDFNSPQSSLEAFLSPGPCQVEGRFPDVFRVIPRFDKLKPHQAGPMNSEYFARIDAVNKLCRNGKYNGAAIRLWSIHDDSDDKFKTGTIVVQFEQAPEVLALIMPMRSFDSLAFPAVARIDGLVTPPPAPAAAAAAPDTPPVDPVTP